MRLKVSGVFVLNVLYGRATALRETSLGRFTGAEVNSLLIGWLANPAVIVIVIFGHDQQINKLQSTEKQLLCCFQLMCLLNLNADPDMPFPTKRAVHFYRRICCAANQPTRFRTVRQVLQFLSSATFYSMSAQKFGELHSWTNLS